MLKLAPAAARRASAALLAAGALLTATGTVMGQDNGGAAPQAVPEPSGQPGSMAPDFALTTLRGTRVSLSALRGHVVLIDYWATWCGPCRMATPLLADLQHRFGASQLRVVGISLDTAATVAQVPAFVRQYKVNYAVCANPRLDGYAAGMYGVQSIPAQFLIDKRGVVRWAQQGLSEQEESELAAMIHTLDAEPAPGAQPGG